jgi:predicted nicotinamide N-methyase
MKEDNRQPFLNVCNHDVYFQQDWGTGIGGGLWSTGQALANYLDTAHAMDQLETAVSHHRNKRIATSTTTTTTTLELGSGNGLLAVCWMAALLRALHKDPQYSALVQSTSRSHQIVVTDTADHLPLVQKTIDINPHIVQNPLLDICVVEHLWGEFSDFENKKDTAANNITERDSPGTVLRPHSFDFILGSDVAYRQELYEPLIASLQHFSHARTVILLGCTMEDTTPRFFDLLRKGGFTYRRLADHVLPQKYQGQQTFGVFVVQRNSGSTYH